MSFLDNLENSLKGLEANNERDSVDDRRRRQSEKDEALRAAPQAERLKKSGFPNALIDSATKVGWPLRIKVSPAWLGSTLRLEARDKRLELRPTPEGIVAVFLENGIEQKREAVDIEGDAEVLARRWLETES